MSYAVGWETLGGLMTVAVIAGALAGVVYEERPDSSDLQWVTPALVFTVTTLLQLGFAVPLTMLGRVNARKTLSLYYAVAAFFGVGAPIAASPRFTVGSFMGVAMGLGAAALALTAFYILRNWPRLGYAHGDAAMFLGSVHAVAFVASAATAAQYWSTGQKLTEWQSALIQTTQLSLTILALPLAVGIWIRLCVRPEQPFTGGRSSPYGGPVGPSPAQTPEPVQLPVPVQRPTPVREYSESAFDAKPRSTWIPFVTGMAASALLVLVLARPRTRR